MGPCAAALLPGLPERSAAPAARRRLLLPFPLLPLPVRLLEVGARARRAARRRGAPRREVALPGGGPGAPARGARLPLLLAIFLLIPVLRVVISEVAHLRAGRAAGGRGAARRRAALAWRARGAPGGAVAGPRRAAAAVRARERCAPAQAPARKAPSTLNMYSGFRTRRGPGS